MNICIALPFRLFLLLNSFIPVFRLLQKARLKRNNAVVIRDSLRNEASKQTKIEQENTEKRDQLVSRVP